MSLHKVLPTTPRLNELIAALALDGKTLIPTREPGSAIFRFKFSEEAIALTAEIFKRVRTTGPISEITSLICTCQIDEIKAAITWATIEKPDKLPALLLLASGRLTSTQLRIVVPLKSAETLTGAKLQLWRGELYEETALESGITSS